MTMTRAHVESAALQLDASDRARLVDVLVTSLAVEQVVDDAWFTELESRVDDAQAGAALVRESTRPDADGASAGPFPQ